MTVLVKNNISVNSSVGSSTLPTVKTKSMTYTGNKKAFTNNRNAMDPAARKALEEREQKLIDDYLKDPKNVKVLDGSVAEGSYASPWE